MRTGLYRSGIVSFICLQQLAASIVEMKWDADHEDEGRQPKREREEISPPVADSAAIQAC
jgi:hypothetical protein